MNLRIDLRPRKTDSLPRGLRCFQEYPVYDHENQKWVHYRELRYDTAQGSAFLVLPPDGELARGTSAAERLLRTRVSGSSCWGGTYGTVSSIRNHQWLTEALPLALVVARASACVESVQGEILDMAFSRPGMRFPRRPFAVPGLSPESALEQLPRGAFYPAARIANGWSDVFQQTICADVRWPLWILSDERSALCLSLLPLLGRLRMDVVGMPPSLELENDACDELVQKLPPGLDTYRFKSEDGVSRLVGLAFDPCYWRNPRIARSLVNLAQALRHAGAQVFVAAMPARSRQPPVVDLFRQLCWGESFIDLKPMVRLLNRATLLNQECVVNIPPPNVICDLNDLEEAAEACFRLQQRCVGRKCSELPKELVDEVAGVMAHLDVNGPNVDGNPMEFYLLPAAAQAAQWNRWMTENPFQSKLDCILSAYVPEFFRISPEGSCFAEIHRQHCANWP
jgi:hypothetical protein